MDNLLEAYGSSKSIITPYKKAMENACASDGCSKALPSSPIIGFHGSTHGTTLIGMKGEDFIIICADSRAIFTDFGNIAWDNATKLGRVCNNVFVARSGYECSGLGILQAPAIKRCTGTHEAANAILNSVKAQFPDGEGGVGYIVAGSVDNKLYTVSRDKKEQKSSGSFPYTAKEDNNIVYMGTGRKYAKTFVEEHEQEFARVKQNANHARNFLKRAMSAARRCDFPTDGDLNIMSLFKTGRCIFHRAEPAGPDPRSGYGVCQKEVSRLVGCYQVKKKNKNRNKKKNK